MMLYAIISTDHPESLSLRKQNRPAHLERLRRLQEQGRLLVAGPHPTSHDAATANSGFTGSLVIAEFPNLHEAEQWAAEDPYQHAGVYANVLVKPFMKVFPET